MLLQRVFYTAETVLVIEQPANNREQHRRLTVPYGRITLPEILIAVRFCLERMQLRAEVVDLRG